MKQVLKTLVLGIILNFQFSIFNIAKADVWDSLCVEPYRIDTADVGVLKAEINALAFFQNNEFSSKIQKGYTLPGGWLQPKLTYAPISKVQLEVGAHLMFYDGANRYPCYAYHDIATWKGNQHQHAVHALPYFRAQADFKRLTLVLGDLYGAQNHNLILPLFNPEQNLSTDPEMGFQLINDRKHNHLDMWINWQSFIFNLDSHQEAFTVGINNTLQWNKDKSRRIQWETPIQIILQHRGGELDTTATGVQTVVNGAIGARMTWRPTKSKLNSLRAEANVLGSWQQHGTLWPFNTGMAIHTAVSMTMLKNLNLEVGYLGAPRQFANLYGSPFFGTISIRHKDTGLTFKGIHTAYANIGYAYTFAPGYSLAAQLQVYSFHTKKAEGTPFGFGIYLRIDPSFVISRKK